MQRIGRPSPSLIIACLALFLAASGGAWASGNVGSANASSTKHHKHKAKRGPRGPRGPQGPQGPPGAAGASEGFVKSAASQIALPSETETTVVQLSLPPGASYILTAVTELGNASGEAGFVDCRLLEGANQIGAGAAQLPAQSVFAQTVTLTGATSGGEISLNCDPENSGQARNSVITAVRVAALHVQ